jgi:hypothetical protein
MNMPEVISEQANVSVANVKPRSGGWSQNYMPPVAMHAVEQAQKVEKKP